MKDKTLKIKGILGETAEVIPKLGLYEVSDFMGKQMHIICIQFYTKEGENLLPYATLTKSFGEFIGMKNCAYIDTNNFPIASQLLDLGIAEDSGLTKQSGFCVYPLWIFKEDFLKGIGGEDYERYSKMYDEYMTSFSGGENDD